MQNTIAILAAAVETYSASTLIFVFKSSFCPLKNQLFTQFEMNVRSNKEEIWREFPELERLFGSTELPSSIYHNGGLRSPYTTRLDDLRDIAEVALCVGSGEQHLERVVSRNPEEKFGDYAARILKLAKELERLESHVRSFANGFLTERIEELRELRGGLYGALDKAEREPRRGAE